MANTQLPPFEMQMCRLRLLGCPAASQPTFNGANDTHHITNDLVFEALNDLHNTFWWDDYTAFNGHIKTVFPSPSLDFRFKYFPKIFLAWRARPRLWQSSGMGICARADQWTELKASHAMHIIQPLKQLNFDTSVFSGSKWRRLLHFNEPKLLRTTYLIWMQCVRSRMRNELLNYDWDESGDLWPHF